MPKGIQLKDAAVDPLQFDDLLSVFQNPETFNTTPVTKASANRLAQDLLSHVAQGGRDDDVFAAFKASMEGYPQPCLVVSDTGQIVSLNGPAYTSKSQT